MKGFGFAKQDEDDKEPEDVQSMLHKVRQLRHSRAIHKDWELLLLPMGATTMIGCLHGFIAVSMVRRTQGIENNHCNLLLRHVKLISLDPALQADTASWRKIFCTVFAQHGKFVGLRLAFAGKLFQ